MSELPIQPFAEEHLEAAGALLAARHSAQRLAEPLLDPRYGEPGEAVDVVASDWVADGASGTVALLDGRLVGYLLGVPSPSPVWGPNVWVGSAGLAVSDPELARDLYAVAATRWVEEGRTAHYVVVPTNDQDLVDAWYRLGFGQQHAHAVCRVPDLPSVAEGEIQVRRAVLDDVRALAVLELVVPQHQEQSPVFAAGELPTLEAAESDVRHTLSDDRFAVWVAEVGGEVVGTAVGTPLELSSIHSPLMRPPHAGFLGYAAVLPEARGLGIARALGTQFLDWTADAGYDSAAIDWRVTNLQASRSWPRLGFRPTFLRLHRPIVRWSM